VDPFLVNIADLQDPKPGKLIRMRRPAWGHGVKDAVAQLQVNDITRANMADSAYITSWMDRLGGADSSMSGMQRTGGPERLTSGEFQGTRGSAMGRMQRLAQILGMQFFQDVGTFFASHTQQYQTMETYVKIAGRYQEDLAKVFGPSKTAKVTPFDLAINYDVLARDGSIPGGNYSDAWPELFKVIGTTPELLQTFDVGKIFMYMAHHMGAKNVGEFLRNNDRIQPTTMPDEQVAAQVQAGNMIPMNQVGVR
jgi:hypothetical protein